MHSTRFSAAHVARARSLAQTLDSEAMIYEIDDDDGDRATRVGPLEYSEEDEFHAFDGRILAVVGPDGAMCL